MILIGSKALEYYAPGIETKDTDFVASYAEVERYIRITKPLQHYPINSGKSMFILSKEKGITEIEIAWKGSRAEKFMKFMEDQDPFRVTVEGLDVHLPSLNILYMLAMSHRYLKDSPHFLKTMEKIHLMRKLGAYIVPEHYEFYKERQEDTYTYHHPKLNVSKDVFFDTEKTGVVQMYDHDSVHWAVKHLDKPAYEYFKQDQSEVYCSKEFFDKQEERVKLLSVLEESYVLAIERSLSVFPNVDPKKAFNMALMKVCTSITSGWWREYAWENYYNVQDMYEEDFYEEFLCKVAKGQVLYKEGLKEKV